MSNTLLPTSFTVTSTFATLASYLGNAGFTGITSNAITGQPGYIINHDTILNLHIGFGTTAPTSYEIVGPRAQLPFLAGANVNEVWVKSASSTISVGFAEGASQLIPVLVNGVIGDLVATTGQVPMADSSGDLIASSISDDGLGAVTIASDVTATGTFTSSDATTPYFETASGKTNTGYLNLKGKTSGAFKILPADATAQTVTMSIPAQTVGAATISLPDFANVSDEFTFKTKSQTMVNKTLTAPVINGATSASGNFDLSGSSGTFLTSTGANTLSGPVTASNLITTVTGTNSIANINTPAGVVKTTAVAGDLEYDGVVRYTTNNTTSGRSAISADNYFRLTATGGTISSIANYFGANSNPILVSGGYYEIDIYAWFLKSTAGTVVWTFTNSAAPTAQDIYYEMSPATGIVAPPGTATMLIGQIYNDATAAKALSATAALSDAVNHYMHTKIWLQNGTGTSLQIQATVSVGTITPGIGSRWFCRRLPAANAGLFAA